MKVIISHPTSNQFNRTVVQGMLDADILQEFHTSIATFPASKIYPLVNKGPLKILKRREFDDALRSFTHTWPWKEAGRMLAPKLGLHRAVKHETGPFCLDAVYRKQDQVVAKRMNQLANRGLSGVYAYEDGALESFRQAKKLGIACLYDLPIGYWRSARKLLEQEKERWPEWASTITGFMDSPIKLQKKDEELALADCVLVASSFTAKTLEDYPGQLPPIEVIPYGFPDVYEQRRFQSPKNRPVRLLFVGGLSQRKGIADLLWAADRLGDAVELTLVGKKLGAPNKALDRELKKHRWHPSLPHQEILSLMRDQDLLVFPSLFEGFGMVISEAMSQGTPVLTTDRTAGVDFIDHGKNGWLVEAGKKEALLEELQNIIAHPDWLPEAGIKARDLARRRPWEVYGSEITAAIQKVLSNQSAMAL